MLDVLPTRCAWPHLPHDFVVSWPAAHKHDNPYTGQAVTTAASEADITVEVVSGPKPARGFIAQPRRWVLEPTTAGSTTAAAPPGTTK